MNPAIAFLISMTFLISVGGLFFMVRGLANDQWGDGTAAAKTIFAKGEVGKGEDPALDGPRRSELKVEDATSAEFAAVDQEELADRRIFDRSSRQPVQWRLTSSIVSMANSYFTQRLESGRVHCSVNAMNSDRAARIEIEPHY